MKDFQHKNIVITGAASGIGKALAVQLAALGANLAIIDIDKEGLQATAQIVAQYQTPVHAYSVNIAQKEQVAQCLESISEVFDHIDLLINNAGISISSCFSHIAISDFEKTALFPYK